MTLTVLARPDYRKANPHLRPFRFRSIAVTHPGCIRKLNEDASLDRPEAGLWAVADGMGGHAAGDVASATVARALEGVSDFTSAFSFRRAVREALMAANDDLQARANEHLLDAIGATVVALIAHGGHYACMWAGDSRAYLLRAGRLERITRDHSLVAELVTTGKLTEAEARNHKGANVVTRAIGAFPKLDLEGCYGAINPGDRFLLCSDGVAATLTDQDICTHLQITKISEAIGSLLRHCLHKGAPDNVTCVLIDADLA